MGGGLMQLVAYGAQDIYLSGNPQITFFKVVYRRHTNFAVESIEQTHNGSAAAGSKISVTVSRNGDLLSQVWLAWEASGAVPSYASLGAIDNVEVEIGGQVIDKQYGHWMHIWNDLTNPTDKHTLLVKAASTADAVTTGAGVVAADKEVYIPLQFWFCRNPGLALPLIALQYHEVKLNITFANSAFTVAGNPTGVTVWCDYIFLDTDERRRFAQVSHEYLIEQVQYSNALSVKGDNAQHELRFNHPVKELVWTVNTSKKAASTAAEDLSDIIVKSALLQLNGHDRFKRRSGKYFTTVQRSQHHSGMTDTNLVVAVASGNDGKSRPHVYSFALKPEEHQPSGTCNFSRIDNAVLNLEFETAGSGTGISTHGGLNGAGGTLKVYAVNYNVLRIMSGMGGLAYSN